MTSARQAQPESTPEVAALARLLLGAKPKGVKDWGRLLHLARRRSVSPFLFHALRARKQLVPADAWQALYKDYLRAAARLSLQERELERVLHTLESAQVPVVLLKGAALCRTLYPDPVSRLMGDTDLWIPRHHLERARAALGSLGYTPLSKTTRPLALQDAYLGETQMVSPQPGTGLVELHWNAFPGEWLRNAAAIDERAIWARTIPIPGLAAHQLTPEDTVLQTCVHFAVNHQMRGLGLRPLLDLALMREHWPVDWASVVVRARAWHLTTATWLVLQLLVSVFGSEGGQLPLELLRPTSSRQCVLQRMASPEAVLEGRCLGTELGRRIFLLFLVDHPADALRLLSRALFPGDEWLTLRYGLEGSSRWRLWFQRVWHPVRAALRTDV